MPIFAMLARSIVSYGVFLLSRKIVNEGLNAGNSIKKQLELHRCFTCWRLYSGSAKTCEFCSSTLVKMYYEEEDFEDEEEERPMAREGLEKRVYKGTENDQYRRKTNRKSSRNYKRRN